VVMVVVVMVMVMVGRVGVAERHLRGLIFTMHGRGSLQSASCSGSRPAHTKVLIQ